MVSFNLNKGMELTEAEKRMLSEAKTLPVVYDEDSPELTDKMEKAFIQARMKKPYHSEPVTIYLSTSTIEKAKSLGNDYISVLGRLLDQAVNDYVTLQ